MTDKPEALRLADALEQQFPVGTAQNFLDGEAAAELRRLHTVNQDLLAALNLAHGSLMHAASDIADWGSYASEYFQKKHGLSDDIQAYTNAATHAAEAIAKATTGETK